MNEQQNPIQNDSETLVSEPTAIVTDTSTQSKQTKKQKKSKKWLWFLLAILLIISVVATYFAIVVLQTQKKTSTDPFAAATRFVTPTALVVKATKNFNGVPLEVTTRDSYGGRTTDGYGAYSLPVDKVAGNEYSNVPSGGYGVGYSGDSQVAQTNYNKLVGFFTANKFQLRTSNKSDAYVYQLPTQNSIDLVSYAVYESSNMLCTVFHVDATSTALEDHVVSIGCANKNDYKAVADAVKPLYASYIDDYTKAKDVIFGIPIEGKGADGYINITAYQEDSGEATASDTNSSRLTSYYFEAPGDNDVTYFTSAKGGGILYCSEYSDATLKKAFMGVACFDKTAQKNSTVQ